jgi:hypothetical protein
MMSTRNFKLAVTIFLVFGSAPTSRADIELPSKEQIVQRFEMVDDAFKEMTSSVLQAINESMAKAIDMSCDAAGVFKTEDFSANVNKSIQGLEALYQAAVEKFYALGQSAREKKEQLVAQYTVFLGSLQTALADKKPDVMARLQSPTSQEDAAAAVQELNKFYQEMTQNFIDYVDSMGVDEFLAQAEKRLVKTAADAGVDMDTCYERVFAVIRDVMAIHAEANKDLVEQCIDADNKFSYDRLQLLSPACQSNMIQKIDERMNVFITSGMLFEQLFVLQVFQQQFVPQFEQNRQAALNQLVAVTSGDEARDITNAFIQQTQALLEQFFADMRAQRAAADQVAAQEAEVTAPVAA